MKLIKHSTDSPEENVALDELFLSKAEAGEEGETIRFWETAAYFVVLGRAGKVNEECLIQQCHNDGLKIIRRLSGGGTVLQGKGCLNYSLILSYSREDKLRQIIFSYEKVLEDIARAFREKGRDVNFFPVSDLALGDKKFSGNAQARKKTHFLHHGTILYDMDISAISRYLKYPPKEPEYRASRPHEEFLSNLGCSPREIKDIISGAFPAEGEYLLTARDLNDLAELVGAKYSRDDWNLMF
jgi:lipoate---protein ligase